MAENKRRAQDEGIADQLEGGEVHRPAENNEEVYFEGSPLLRGNMGRLLGFGAIGLVLLGAPLLWRYLLAEPWPHWIVMVVLAALGLIFILAPIVMTRTIRYRISNYRIDYERGILGKAIDTLELWHVDDIRFNQSLIDRILNVGTITVISNDHTTPTLPLHGIPNPRPVFDSLKQRIIAVKRQRGVIKMDLG